MRHNSLPQTVLVRLLDLDQRAANAMAAADKAEAALTFARDVMGNRREIEREEFEKVQASFDSVLATAKATRQRAELERGVLKDVREWVENLNQSTKLCLVQPPPADLDLSTLQHKLEGLRSELQNLNQVVVPASDLDDKVKSYVAALQAKAAPMLRGLGQGQLLDVKWPGAIDASRLNGNGFNSTGHPLLMFAALMPDALAAVLMQSISAACPLTKTQIENRRIELTAAIDEMSFVVAGLLDRANLPPDAAMNAWHHLGVKISDDETNGNGENVRPIRRRAAPITDQPSA